LLSFNLETSNTRIFVVFVTFNAINNELKLIRVKKCGKDEKNVLSEIRVDIKILFNEKLWEELIAYFPFTTTYILHKRRKTLQYVWLFEAMELYYSMLVLQKADVDETRC
jgi:hypothetical protein